MRQAAGEERRADEQHDRQPDLRDDQDAGGGGCCAPVPVGDASLSVTPICGREARSAGITPETIGGQHRERHGEGDPLRVDARVEAERERRARHERVEHPGRPAREQRRRRRSPPPTAAGSRPASGARPASGSRRRRGARRSRADARSARVSSKPGDVRARDQQHDRHHRPSACPAPAAASCWRRRATAARREARAPCCPPDTARPGARPPPSTLACDLPRRRAVGEAGVDLQPPAAARRQPVARHHRLLHRHRHEDVERRRRRPSRGSPAARSPTIVNARPFSVTARPTAAGSPAKARCQRSCEMTATASRSGTTPSSGRKPRPSDGADAEEVEEVRRHQLAEDADRLAAPCAQVDRQHPERDEIRDAVRFAPRADPGSWDTTG